MKNLMKENFKEMLKFHEKNQYSDIILPTLKIKLAENQNLIKHESFLDFAHEKSGVDKKCH